MIVRQDPGAILSLAEKSGDPMEFLSKMGESIAKSGMLGLRKIEQGSTLLMICMTEGKTPLQVISEFHVMDDGKLARKADWVISRFREMGGSFVIVDDGEDGQKATYEFTFKGNTRRVSYTMDEAKAEKIVKKDSRWEKNPASMLRARVITKGVRMVAPEVMAGFYTEEELDGQTDGPTPTSPKGRTTATAKDKVEPAATVATTATSVPVTTSQSTSQQTAQPATETADQLGEVIDAEFSVTDKPATTGTAAAATEQPPFDANKKTPEDHKKETLIMDITFQLGRLGMSVADYETGYFKKYGDFKTLDDMPIERLEEQLTKVRTVADAKTAKN